MDKSATAFFPALYWLLVACAFAMAAEPRVQVSGKRYTDKQIETTHPTVFFQRMEKTEIGYHPFAAMWALLQKAQQNDPGTKDAIVGHAIEIVGNDSEHVQTRWQCCYVLSGIGNDRAIQALRDALLGKQPEVLRCVAACALGALQDKEAARKALIEARGQERSDRVLASINTALQPASHADVRQSRSTGKPEAPPPKLTLPMTETTIENLPWPHQPPGLTPQEAQELSREVWVINDFPLYQSDFAGQRRYFHGGLDIVLENGTRIYAMKDGWVKSIHAASIVLADAKDDSPCFGWEYTHLSDFQVSPGDFVKKGTWIGSIDFRGLAHIHLSKVFSEGSYWGSWAFYCIPNAHFDYTDEEAPVIQTPFWFFRNNSDEMITTPPQGTPIVSGAVDIVVAARDGGQFAHSKQTGFGDRLSPATIQYKIASLAENGTAPLSFASFDFRKLRIKRGVAAPAYSTELTKVVFKHPAQFDSKPRSGDADFSYYVITNCPKKETPQELDVSFRDHCWDTAQRNELGEPIFPNGLYQLKVTATDFAGNSSNESVTVEVANPD